MEEVYSEVERVSLSKIDGAYNALFRGRPGKNAADQPGALGKVVVSMEDVHITSVGVDTATRHEDEGVSIGVYFPDGEGIVLLDRERRRLRCGPVDAFDELDQSYIELYQRAESSAA